jgi:hypothetical protein
VDAAIARDVEMEGTDSSKDKTQPALRIMRELLSKEYEFKEVTKVESRNQDDLAASLHTRVIPPMSSKVPGALLCAMESVFGAKVAEANATKAVKKRWPGSTARLPRKKSIQGLPVPMIWGAKYFSEGGLSLPPALTTPSNSVTRTYHQLEGQVAILQRGVKSASAVALAIQAARRAVDTEESLPQEFAQKVTTLLAFAAHASHHSIMLPLQQIVADTATMRELALSANNIPVSDPKYSGFLRAPFVNSSLFPGCAQALEKARSKYTRPHSFYSRGYTTKGFANVNNKRRFYYKQKRRGDGRKNEQEVGPKTFQRSFYQTTDKQPQQSNFRGRNVNRGMRARYFSAPASMQTALSSPPAELMVQLEKRELEPVGACLKGKQGIWKRFGASVWLQSVLRHGFKPRFSDFPKVTLTPLLYQPPPEKISLLRGIVSDLLHKRAIIEIENPESSPGFYSLMFTRPKKNGGVRPIFNMKPLNKHVLKESFRMESPISIAETMSPGAWACSLDLSDAYLHVPMHESIQKFLRFTLEHRAFQFVSLPFGLNISAWVFTKLASVAVSFLHSSGLALSAYIDDWLVHHPNLVQLSRHRDQVMETLLAMGWHINSSKSEFKPSQNFVYLGVRFDSVKGTLANTTERAEEIAGLLGPIGRSLSTTPRMLRKVIGKITFFMHYTPFGKANARPLQWLLKDHWNREEATLDSSFYFQLSPEL